MKILEVVMSPWLLCEVEKGEEVPGRSRDHDKFQQVGRPLCGCLLLNI